MTQNTHGFPSRPIQYSAPEIPKKPLPWFIKLLALFALLLVIGVGYSFWRISRVAQPVIDAPTGEEAPPADRSAPAQ